jgi:pimeloyl-ACP methyl ester carboxylesterase
MYEGTGHELAGAEDRAAADTARWLTELGLGARPRVTTRLVDVSVGGGDASALSMQAGLLFEPEAGPEADAPAVMLLYDRGQDVLINLSEWIAPWLAQRGYRVLVPQDSSFGPNVDRIGELGTDADLAAWVRWLGEGGRRPVVVAGSGWGGERAARFLLRHPQKSVKGLAFLGTPSDGARWARAELGDAAYDAAVARASSAVASGRGGATLIAARSVQPGSGAGRPPYRVHMLADAFLARFGPQRLTLERVLAELPQAVFLARGAAAEPATQPEVTALAAAAGSRATVYPGDSAVLRYQPDPALADGLLRWLRRVGAGEGR